LGERGSSQSHALRGKKNLRGYMSFEKRWNCKDDKNGAGKDKKGGRGKNSVIPGKEGLWRARKPSVQGPKRKQAQSKSQGGGNTAETLRKKPYFSVLVISARHGGRKGEGLKKERSIRQKERVWKIPPPMWRKGGSVKGSAYHSSSLKNGGM